MFSIDIKYFGQVGAATGKSRETIQLNNPTTVSEFKKYIVDKYPELKNIRYQIAVNLKVADDEKHLKDKDELALLPPFAGG